MMLLALDSMSSLYDPDAWLLLDGEVERWLLLLGDDDCEREGEGEQVSV